MAADYKHPSGILFHADCQKKLKELESSSVDLILTDPPYFIDGMGDNWSNCKLKKRIEKAGVVGGRPIGMKFERSQSYNFQKFLEPISEQCFRLLKPGGFFISFSQARLYHRLACAAEDAGFELRDMMAWHHNGQAKAFTQNHFIEKNKSLSLKEKKEILKKLQNRKTPQLKPQLEPMILAQKPKEGTFVNNWLSYELGLMDAEQTLDGNFPGNLMSVAKPNKHERGEGNFHFTVKPIRLLSHLIKLFTSPGQVVLDPFMGSGSTALAAMTCDRQFIGVEKDLDFFKICQRRIKTLNLDEYEEQAIA